jgi:predicted patatin/cPLA2 family phospholipase
MDVTDNSSALTPVNSSLLKGHPVLELVARRAASGSTPGARDDQDRLALVVEGGGMRGVVSGGMVTALEELGLQQVFDLVVGTSAGALAGAFFLAGQSRMGTSIYYEDLTGREWLDYRRGVTKAPILAFDYLFEDLMGGRKPLDWQAVIDSPTPLYAVATELPDYKRALLDEFRSAEELRLALSASARIPLVTGPPIELNNTFYIDGSLKESIPMIAALDLGATHMLVLLTRPPGKVRPDPGVLQRRLLFPYMSRRLAGLGDIYSQRAPRYRLELARLDELEKQQTAFGIRVAEHFPPVSQLEQNPRKLFSGAARGAEAVHFALTGSTDYSFGELGAEA